MNEYLVEVGTGKINETTRLGALRTVEKVKPIFSIISLEDKI